MQLVIKKVYTMRVYIIYIPFHIGGSLYSTGKFSNSSDILLVTDIVCSQSDTSISQCTISHYTKTTSCDVKDIAAVRCHSTLKYKYIVGNVPCGVYAIYKLFHNYLFWS